MKTIIKKALALTLACLLIASLCGCSALDEMRKSQAFLQENGDIAWNDTTYKPLPKNPFFDPLFSSSSSVSIHLTEPDVPVLMSVPAAKDFLSTDNDQIFLGDGSDGIWYCRQDQYEVYSAKMSEPFTPVKICYENPKYDYEENSSPIAVLSQAQTDAVRNTLETTKPVVLADGLELNREWSLDLREASEDLLMHQELAELVYTGSQYYLVVLRDVRTVLYQIPEKSAPYFSRLNPF